ncbi:MAG: hypothetical protein ACYC56_02675 [Candidatus Aquicultor sp.]
MLILGEPNDKGRQLEELTRVLLANMSVTDITVREIRAGGEEIDVSGSQILPMLGGAQTHQIICECKAHNSPIDLPQWLKFLGKVFAQEKSCGVNISGCFISLSGVNGNVMGHFKELRNHYDKINLVEGDDLLKSVSKVFNLSELDVVKLTLSKYTDRQVFRHDIAYYDGCVYWILFFSADKYTILDSTGALLSEEQRSVLCPLIEDIESARSYIDLEQEEQARERLWQLERDILSQIMMNNGSVASSELIAIQTGQNGFTAEECEKTIDNLIGHDWILRSGDRQEVGFHAEDADNYYERLALIYRVLVARPPIVEVLGCDYFDAHINERLISEIQRIQGGLVLSPEDIEEISNVLKISPHALSKALRPDPIVIALNAQPGLDGADLDKFKASYFMVQLYFELAEDFKSSSFLFKYFYETRGLREIDILQKIQVKSETGIELDREMRQRRGLEKAFSVIDEEIMDGYLPSLLPDNTPEPWDY